MYAGIFKNKKEKIISLQKIQHQLITAVGFLFNSSLKTKRIKLKHKNLYI